MPKIRNKALPLKWLPQHKARPELLMHPNIPKPLHGTNPRTILGETWWDEHRQIAYKENHYHCWACNVHKLQATYYKWLEAHEHYNINYKTGEVTLKEIVALCHSCHNFIHSGRLCMLVDSAEIPHHKAVAIMQQGLWKLRNASLLPPYHAAAAYLQLTSILVDYEVQLDEEQDSAVWEDWHLVLNGEKHYSKFKSYEDWERYYSGV